MHELSLVGSIVEQVQGHAEGRPVKSITLSVGVLTCVDPDAMQFCFEACKQDAKLEQAQLIIKRQLAKGRCRQCHREFEITEAIQPCECGSLEIDLSGGGDVMLTELEFI